MIAKLDEETLRKLRRQDLDSLKFGGGLDVLNRALQGLPAAIDKSIKAVNNPWKKVNGKWVEVNPKTGSPFTKAELQIRNELTRGRYPGSLKPKITGEFGSKGNLPKAINQNIAVPLKDALTDIVNMPTGKFDALGPASSRAYKLKTQGMADIRGTSGDNYAADEIRLGKRAEELGNQAALQNNLNTPSSQQPQSISNTGLANLGPNYKAQEIALSNAADAFRYDKAMRTWADKTRNSPAGKLMHAGKPVFSDAERFEKHLRTQAYRETHPQPWDRWFRSDLNSKKNLADQAKTKRKFGLNTNKPTNPVPKPPPKTPPATNPTAATPKGSNALGIASMIAGAVGGLLGAKQTVPGKAAENRSLGWVDPLPGGISGHYG